MNRPGKQPRAWRSAEHADRRVTLAQVFSSCGCDDAARDALRFARAHLDRGELLRRVPVVTKTADVRCYRVK